jgi:hypothetical protein
LPRKHKTQTVMQPAFFCAFKANVVWYNRY